jgi:hypothetical protein
VDSLKALDPNRPIREADIPPIIDHLSGSVASYHTKRGLLAVNHARLLRRRGGQLSRH